MKARPKGEHLDDQRGEYTCTFNRRGHVDCYSTGSYEALSKMYLGTGKK
ncbi:MAG: hypothetical protein IH892_22600 [Planctomycetes bacterium]|nr:hypothetical protein [Planctomycetota bacterium]